MTLSRRRYLASISAGATLLGGCVGGGGDPPQTRSTPTTPPFEFSEQPRSCGGTDGSSLVHVTPLGVSLVVDGRSRAEAIREEVLEALNLDEEPDVRIVEEDGSGGGRVVLEFAPYQWSAEFFRERYGDDASVRTIRNGRSLSTVRTVASELRTGLLGLDGVDGDHVSVAIVRPAPPAAMSVDATVSGGGWSDQLESAQSFSLRFVTPERERLIAAPSDITPTGTRSEPMPGIVMNLSRSAMANTTRAVADVGPTQVAGNPQYTVRLYFEAEVLWEGRFSHDLVTSVVDGDWDGQIVAGVESRERMDEVVERLGLFSFSVPAVTDVERCE